MHNKNIKDEVKRTLDHKVCIGKISLIEMNIEASTSMAFSRKLSYNLKENCKNYFVMPTFGHFDKSLNVNLLVNSLFVK